MKYKTLLIPFVYAMFSSLTVLSAPPPLRAPLAPAINPEPKLLTSGQRAWVTQELHLILDDLTAAWAVVDGNPALAPIKAKIDLMKTNTAPESADALKFLNLEYNNARTLLFAEMDGMTNKQARALLYGRMLQYDTKLQTNLRRRGLVPTAIDPEPPEEEQEPPEEEFEEEEEIEEEEESEFI